MYDVGPLIIVLLTRFVGCSLQLFCYGTGRMRLFKGDTIQSHGELKVEDMASDVLHLYVYA